MSETLPEMFLRYVEMMTDDPDTRASNFHLALADGDSITVFLIRDQEVIEAITKALDRITDNDPTGRRSDVVRKEK